MFQTVYPIGYRKRLGATSVRVGRDIISAQSILEDARNRQMGVPELFTKINWTLNVVHQAGTMAGHVANDMGISVQYLTKLSNLDVSAWDAELEAMSTPRGATTEAVGELLNMIVGASKAHFESSSDPFKMSLPTTVVGGDYTVHIKANPNATVAHIPFSFEGSDLSIEIFLS